MENTLYDRNAASALLGCLMKNPALLLNPSFPLYKKDFECVAMHGILFICIRELLEAGTREISALEIDTVAKTNSQYYDILVQNDYIGYIDAIKELANHNNFEYFYTVVRKYSLLREMKENGISITDFFDPITGQATNLEKFESITLEEMVARVNNIVSNLRNKYDVRFVRNQISVGEDTEGLLEFFEKAPAFGACLQSGVLSTIVQGWNRGHLLCRSGPSGASKTKQGVGDLCMVSAPAYYSEEAGDFVVNPNYQGPGFYIHTEMDSRTEVEPAFLSFVACVEYRKMRNGLLTKEERLRVLKAGEILKKSNLQVIDMPEYTSASLEQKIRDMAEFGCPFGVFDYVELNSSLGAEFKSVSNMPVREDLVLKSLVTDLKGYAEKYNVGILTGTQLNDTWKEKAFPDESCLSGAKSIKNKLDAGTIIIPFNQRRKEMECLKAFLPKPHFGEPAPMMPNMIEYVYKSRFGTYGDEKVKIIYYFDKGTSRRYDFFCADDKDKIVNVPKTELEPGGIYDANDTECEASIKETV